MKLLFTLLLVPLFHSNQAQDVSGPYSEISFRYDETSGIGFDESFTRRDNSDILKVGDTHYVYYTKKNGNGNWAGPEGGHATIWYAISIDEGFTWIGKGEAISFSRDPNTFDSHSVYTPNVLCAEGKYYLYYTGIKATWKMTREHQVFTDPILRILLSKVKV